ncbi:hypothetical protein ABIE62_000669 [Porphyrobacter sp. MBR-155]|jgi:hypothetical protein|uniref:hypothetical protein n=1 Tax=Porphyrobacter sp. MBR-155 TaxID=3156464 RepID=UPI003394F3C6
MKIIQYIPIAAGILFSGQLLASEPQAGPDPLQPVLTILPAPAVAESNPRAPIVQVQLSPDQLDRVTAGLGRDNVATQPWAALIAAGFSLHHNSNADKGLIDHAGHLGTAVPSTVPNSICLAFC